VLIVSKILIAISLVGLLRCSAKFRTASREFDERVFAVLKRMMHLTEDRGYPAELAPMLILLSALCFMLSMQALQLLVR
jgi:hypothetical protein